MQKFAFPKLYIIICALLIYHVSSFAQRPPTGGPNPTETKDSDIPFIVYPAIGITVGAVSYYTIRKLRKIPTGKHVESYLVKHQIMPTTDAVALMHSLNPDLKNSNRIRRNYKLVEPEFPALPQSISTNNSLIQNTFPEDLSKQVSLFEENKSKFSTSKTIAIPKGVAVGKVDIALDNIAKNINLYKEGKQKNQITSQMMADLLEVLNQTLKRSIDSNQLNSADAVLIESISENVSEIVSPLAEMKTGSGKQSELYFKNKAETENNLYTSANTGAKLTDQRLFTRYPEFTFSGPDALFNKNTVAYQPPDNDMLKAFAFAIYKIDSSGKPITNGSEVESKYIIQYVCPALKDYESTYHNLSPPASWAFANLPPAKYYLKVKDINGRQVLLKNPLIDMRDEFNNPQRSYHEGMIKVLLFITE